MFLITKLRTTHKRCMTTLPTKHMTGCEFNKKIRGILLYSPKNDDVKVGELVENEEGLCFDVVAELIVPASIECNISIPADAKVWPKEKSWGSTYLTTKLIIESKTVTNEKTRNKLLDEFGKMMFSKSNE